MYTTKDSEKSTQRASTFFSYIEEGGTFADLKKNKNIF